MAEATTAGDAGDADAADADAAAMMLRSTSQAERHQGGGVHSERATGCTSADANSCSRREQIVSQHAVR